MIRYTKFFLFFIILFVFLFAFIKPVIAEENNVVVEFFYSSGDCEQCEEKKPIVEEIEEYYPNCEIILIDTFLVDECDDEIKYVSINPLCKDENFFLDCIQVHAHRLGFQEGFLCSEDIELNEKVKSEKKLLCHFLTIENSIGSKEQLYDQLAESVTNSIVRKGSKKRLDMESFKTLEYSSH